MKKNFKKAMRVMNERNNNLKLMAATAAGLGLAKATESVAKSNTNVNENSYELGRYIKNDVKMDVNVSGTLTSPDITGTENGHLKLSINSPLLGEIKLEFDSETTYTCGNESIKVASQETRENLKALKQFLVDCIVEGANAVAEAANTIRGIEDEPHDNGSTSNHENPSYENAGDVVNDGFNSNDGFDPVD